MSETAGPREYKPKQKTEKEMAVLLYMGRMPSTGPYVSPHRTRPFFETEQMLTDFVAKGWAVRENIVDHRGSWAGLTYEGHQHFGFHWQGPAPEHDTPETPS